jgi:anti-anti-sigma factor
MSEVLGNDDVLDGGGNVAGDVGDDAGTETDTEAGDGLVPAPRGRVRTRIEHAAGCVVIHVDGDVDFTTAELLRVQVITAALSVSPPRVVLDMRGVTWCDSSGLAALVAIYRAIHADQGGGLVLARPTPYCREILKRTGLDQRLTLSDTLDGAMALIFGSAPGSAGPGAGRARASDAGHAGRAGHE